MKLVELNLDKADITKITGISKVGTNLSNYVYVN